MGSTGKRITAALIAVAILAGMVGLVRFAVVTAHDQDCSIAAKPVELTSDHLGATGPPRLSGYASSPTALANMASRVVRGTIARGYLYDIASFNVALARVGAEQEVADQIALAESEQCENDHTELHSRPRVELLATTIRDCGYNDCMLFRLRNNHHLTVTDLKIRIYPRDRWGVAVTRCGYYGGTWTWWSLRGAASGGHFTVQNDEACLRGLGPKSSGELVLVMFSDGSTWRP